MPDQADALRLLMTETPLNDESRSGSRVIAVASGKGGVGKSNLCVNFGLCLMRQGYRVIIIDVDMGFANVELLIGARPSYNLMDVINGHSIWDVISESDGGLSYLSAGTGLTDIHSLGEEEMNRLLKELALLSDRYDYILIDSGAGLGVNMRRLLCSSDDFILVTTPEPTAIADAYSLLKLMARRKPTCNARVVVNRAASFVEAKLAADKLAAVAQRFLGVTLTTLGFVLEDDTVGQAVMKQEPFLTAFPNSSATRCMNQLVQNYLRTELDVPRQGFSAFLERFTKRFRSGYPA